MNILGSGGGGKCKPPLTISIFNISLIVKVFDPSEHSGACKPGLLGIKFESSSNGCF